MAKKIKRLFISTIICISSLFSTVTSGLFVNISPFTNVYADDTNITNDGLGSIIMMWLCAMGLTVSATGNIGKWVYNQFHDFILTSKYSNIWQDIEKSLIISNTTDITISKDAYNAVSEFATYLDGTHDIGASTTSVKIGSINMSYDFVNTVVGTNSGTSSRYFNVVDYYSSGEPIYCYLSTSRLQGTFYYFASLSAFNVSYQLYTNGAWGGVSTSQSTFKNNYYEFSVPLGIFNAKPVIISNSQIVKYYGSVYGWLNGTYIEEPLPLEDVVYGMENGDTWSDRVITGDSSATLSLPSLVLDGVTSLAELIAKLNSWAMTDDLATELEGVRIAVDSISVPTTLPVVTPTAIPVPTTDIYPTTLPDATTDPDVEPWSGDTSNYAVPGLLTVFPFCVPYDVYALFNAFNVEEKAPVYDFHFKLANFGIDEKITIDFNDFSILAKILKYSLFGLFLFGLILLTRYIVGGQ